MFVDKEVRCYICKTIVKSKDIIPVKNNLKARFLTDYSERVCIYCKKRDGAKYIQAYQLNENDMLLSCPKCKNINLYGFQRVPNNTKRL